LADLYAVIGHAVSLVDTETMHAHASIGSAAPKKAAPWWKNCFYVFFFAAQLPMCAVRSGVHSARTHKGI
jgi:nicotinamide riboside transporter PnuC